MTTKLCPPWSELEEERSSEVSSVSSPSQSWPLLCQVEVEVLEVLVEVLGLLEVVEAVEADRWGKVHLLHLLWDCHSPRTL